MATILAAMSGCLAGDGSTLDDLGTPVDHPDYPSLASFENAKFPATLEALQRFFFDAHCTRCHGGASAPMGLSLADVDSARTLIGVPSAERPDLALVELGQPDRSYLVMKLEGASGIAGRQMPRRAPPRPQAEIDVIREWIATGCPDQ